MSLGQKTLDQNELYQPLGTKGKVEGTAQSVDLGSKTDGVYHKGQSKETPIGQKLEMMLQVLYLCKKSPQNLVN